MTSCIRLEQSFDAEPSTPRPTAQPALTRSLTGQIPDARAMLEDGQWLMLTRASPRRLISSAPKDMYAAQGKLGRRLYVLPTHQLVITRLGDQAGNNFNSEFFKLISYNIIIKVNIVRYKNLIFCIAKYLWSNLTKGWCISNHSIINSC